MDKPGVDVCGVVGGGGGSEAGRLRYIKLHIAFDIKYISVIEYLGGQSRPGQCSITSVTWPTSTPRATTRLRRNVPTDRTLF